MQNVAAGDTLTLCQGIIQIQNAIVASASDIQLSCQNPGQCTLKQQGTASILRLTGNNNKLTDLYFFDADSSQNGGAVYLNGDNNEVIGCRFTNNRGKDGGGLYALGSVTVENSQFYSNLAQLRGGAMAIVGQSSLAGNDGGNNSARQCSDIYYSNSGSCGSL